MQQQYRKHFIPLESTPEIFNQLSTSLGARPCLEFQDVLTLDEPNLFPHPAIALILVFPTTNQYEARRVAEFAADTGPSSVEDDQIMWFPQTINNACGLYGILHALSNGIGRSFLEPGSWLANLLATSRYMSPMERASLVEDSAQLEVAYAEVAVQGESCQPERAEDDVDFHYICLVRSPKNGHLYELDGDRKGPIDRGDVLLPEEDLLGQGALQVVREYFENGEDGIGFSLMALVAKEDAADHCVEQHLHLDPNRVHSEDSGRKPPT
ncbi:hypothetical protein NLU13_5209 [Sarocladium strictum]|uniref:Ubiquitin carboxyl-terminal hydrolase n=1 Tax=Sarocladium strictum TaxID=5046 RepID=A0AA39L701_SARSR|nr:hypothetical protein NLU13_5209 [Sarocladium strictum]